MGQVTAVREVQPEDGVARLQQRHERSRIGLRSGVRLHVRMFGAEYLLRAVARDVLHHIGVFAAAVVALAWVAFSVLVREDRTRGLQYRARDKVLARDHLQAFVLAENFILNQCRNFGVDDGKRGVQVNRHITLILRWRPMVLRLRISQAQPPAV